MPFKTGAGVIRGPTVPIMIPFHKDSRFIVLSDCHRGNGAAGDEFACNFLIYKCALEHYLKEGFTYITHTSIYDLLRRFHDPDPAKTRYFQVWGNHDED